MLTVKCKAYTTEELNMLYDVLNEGIVMVQSMNCNQDCADTIEARQVKMRILADGE